MDAFHALAEPRRRHILEMLAAEGELPASAICSRFRISHPAISQHLKVLRESGLVAVERRAQMRIYRMNPEKVHELEDWAQRTLGQWNRRFEAMDEVLEEEKRRKTGGKHGR